MSEPGGQLRGRPGRPPKLNRERIVATAIEIITDEGFDRLSMRYLADRLGTSPMGIYYYFESKTDLLGFMLAHDSDGPATAPLARDPYERTVQVALSLAGHLSAHAWALSALLGGEIGDEATDRALAELQAAMADLGFDEAAARETVQGIWRIVVGHVVAQPGGPTDSASPANEVAGVRETVASYLDGRLLRASTIGVLK